LLVKEFACILLDVNMPIMDGFETAALIRQRFKSQTTPILFVTALNTADSDMQKGYSIGAVDYILTPLIPEVLKAKVKVFVELFEKTELLKNQTEILEKANRLLTEHANQIQELNEKLNFANKELESFSYSVSHDLRAPLRHIIGFVDMLNKTTQEKLNEKELHYLKVISNSSVQMGSLIDDLLAFSRIGRTEMQKLKFNPNNLLKKLLDENAEEIKMRQIELNITELPDIIGDETLLQQVFVNLISNALKYTRKQPKPVITIGSKTGAYEIIFFVKDNGAGFNMDYVQKLFGVFQRLHSADEFEGTGIGLANVQRIVTRHGGRVWAEGEVGKGACFYFALPIMQ
jgi:light-regulated signal transduction histidine kinase (bacteriophytochrome)